MKFAVALVALLAVGQLAVAREIQPFQPNIPCAQELGNTIQGDLTQFFDVVRTKVVELITERRHCASLSGAAGVVCWTRHRAEVIFAISDLITDLRQKRENFNEYALNLLETYYQCRESDQIFEQFDDLFAELDSIFEELNELAPDVQCAIELGDSLRAIIREFTDLVRARFLALRTIRRECQTLSGTDETRCWIRFRIEILFSVTDTIRDLQARRENFNRVTLGLLEEYYQCREE